MTDAIEISGDDAESKLVVKTSVDTKTSSGGTLTIAMKGSAPVLDLSTVSTINSATVNVTNTAKEAAVATSTNVTLAEVTNTGSSASVAVTGSGTVTTTSGNVEVVNDTVKAVEVPASVADIEYISGEEKTEEVGQEEWAVEATVENGTITVTEMIADDYGETILGLSLSGWGFQPSQYAQGAIIVKFYIPDGAETFDQYSGADLTTKVREAVSVDDSTDSPNDAESAYMYMVLGVGNIPSTIKMVWKDSEEATIATQIINLVAAPAAES